MAVPAWVFEATLALIAALFLTTSILLGMLVGQLRRSARTVESLAQEAVSQMAATLRSMETTSEELREAGRDARRQMEEVQHMLRTADAVLDNVRFTTRLVQTRIGPPLIQAASLLSGIGQGLSFLAKRGEKKGVHEDV
ncbi:MAG: hypothetical protein M0Z27_02715 [Thermaerobacter sp.]|nr:hypothetical protein [Thermaerobacter sp.]